MKDSQTKRYSYHKEGDEYVLYDGEEKVCNPDDEVISTDNEDLAAKLVQALEDGEDYTSPGSLLCYHYTYCNLRQHAIEEFVEQFSSCMTYDAFLWDHYLMFKQPAPVRQAYAVFFSEEYSFMIKSLNKYQFVAIMILHQSYDSWVLPYRIIQDIIELLDSSSYHELKDKFMEELDEYERAEFADAADGGDEIDEDEYASYRSNLSQAIDKFVYYYSIK